MVPNCPANAGNELVLRWGDALGRFLRCFCWAWVWLCLLCFCYVFVMFFVICLVCGMWLRNSLQSLIIAMCGWLRLRPWMILPQDPKRKKHSGLLVSCMYSFCVMCGRFFFPNSASNISIASFKALRWQTFSGFRGPRRFIEFQTFLALVCCECGFRPLVTIMASKIAPFSS